MGGGSSASLEEQGERLLPHRYRGDAAVARQCNAWEGKGGGGRRRAWEGTRMGCGGGAIRGLDPVSWRG
jgi:hypothetical protein